MPQAVALVAAYVIGGIPFSNLMSRAVAGVDLRHAGSGTVSGTGLYRVAGLVPLIVAGILDVAKGAAAVVLAGSERPLLQAGAAGLAVAGHNWSPFLKGAGGRGVAPTLGALLVAAWPAPLLLLGFMIAGKAFDETGLGTFVGLLALVPAAGLVGGGPGAAAGIAVAVPMLVKRALGNAPSRHDPARLYLERMLYDRPGESDLAA
jgi:glycerol-3-phosphate acyltransferase PlsY